MLTNENIMEILDSHSSDNNIHFSSGEKDNLSQAYEHSVSDHAPTDAEKNIIVGVQKNGEDLPVDEETRKIDVSVPTKLSELENDTGFITQLTDGGVLYDLNNKELQYSVNEKEVLFKAEQLIANLEASGQLEDTVIALVGDHYPYTLTTEEMNEMSDYEKDGIVEVNKSNFIIWNSEMEEPIIVDKLGSQIDVLPTLLNLFGIEYDSRLIVGKDILSDTGCVAIFSNYSWVSDYGTYFANKRQFVPKAGKTLENQDEYVKAMNNRVSNAYSISKMILDTDYYTYVLESE